MFTRVVELVSKQRKARELSSTINEKIVPILKKQPGFVDEIVLVSDADSNRVLALSFWKTVFAMLCSPCWRPNQWCARLRSIPQPGTRSQPARLPERNFKNNHKASL